MSIIGFYTDDQGKKRPITQPKGRITRANLPRPSSKDSYLTSHTVRDKISSIQDEIDLLRNNVYDKGSISSEELDHVVEEITTLTELVKEKGGKRFSGTLESLLVDTEIEIYMAKAALDLYNDEGKVNWEKYQKQIAESLANAYDLAEMTKDFTSLIEKMDRRRKATEISR